MKVKGPTRRTQAERTAATRAQLLSAARELFAANGFGEVSTQAIAEAAGVTRGALYHQFDDKADLFAAVYEQVEEQLAADVIASIAAEQPDGTLAAMRIGARLFLDRTSASGVAQIALIDAPTVLGWERWREVGIRYGLGIIEGMLTQAIADGVIPAQPPRATAHVLLSALDEAALYVSRSADPAGALHEMYAVCDRLIDGLAAN